MASTFMGAYPLFFTLSFEKCKQAISVNWRELNHRIPDVKHKNIKYPSPIQNRCILNFQSMAFFYAHGTGK